MPLAKHLFFSLTLAAACLPVLATASEGQGKPLTQHPHHPAKAASKSVVGQAAAGELRVSQAWVRQAVKGQSGTGGFMRLISAKGGTLLGFSTPVAQAELHEMAMDGDVMRMRPVSTLPLPAGVPVDLKPGSYHLMLMNLKKPLSVGDKVPLTLKFKSTNGKVSTQQVEVPVLLNAPEGAAQ